jgi:diguanylate cyclase (GGDEF)-like protein/PAS domain S-box-containing protein
MASGGGSSKVIKLPRAAGPVAPESLTGRFPGINRALLLQLKNCYEGGNVDLERLLQLVSRQYDQSEDERRGIVRSMQMMSEEAQELTRELREQSTMHLRAILDHVKDVILTVDETGHIDTFNPTGERVFGYAQAEVIGRPLSFLLPDMGQGGPRLAERLDNLAMRAEDTHLDLAAHETTGRNKSGERFTAELAVSKAKVQRRQVYILCLRDATERKIAESSTRESEARYRLLVENAPEAIVVLDVDRRCFVDCNQHAEEFFKMDRATLLSAGAEQISPPTQADGTPSFGIVRGYIDRALKGETPVFEWTHRDSAGHDIPCEVRLARLPTARRRLIRGSITDIADRKRAELIAACERRVLERLASNADLDNALEAIADLIERAHAGALCAIRLLDPTGRYLQHAVSMRLPREYCAAMDGVPVGMRYGSCAAAVYLARQVIVANIETDALWEYRRDLARAHGLCAAWSTPILSSSGVIIGTVALYLPHPATPSGREFELMARATQLAGIAIERRRSEAALRASESRYRGLFENVVEGVYQSTLEGKLLAGNQALLTMLGFETLAELQAVPTTKEFYADPAVRDRAIAQLLQTGEIRNFEWELKRRDGRVITVRENARLVRDGGHASSMVSEGTLSDITERKRAELAVLEEKERAQVTLQSIGDAVITTDAAGVIDYLNPVAEHLTGWPLAEARGASLDQVLKVINEASREPAENLAVRCLREGGVIVGGDQAALIDRIGRELPIQNSAASIRARDGRLLGTVVVFRDVSHERRLRRALSYQATHDALTGLINRREFEQRLHNALGEVREDPTAAHALVYLDLDQFKVVNDTCGHPAGDRLLKQITGLLQTRVRASDTLARLGGDEFGILLQDCSIDQAMKIAESLRQSIREFRFEGAGQTLQLGASIGIVALDQSTESVAGVMSAVDVACYAAKDQGRNRVHLYQINNVPERHREMQWVSRLQRACDDGRLEIFFQPIVPIGDTQDRRGHYELMLRMRDEDGALVQPIEFIPAAERYNVMPAIDRWVVRQALDTLLRRTSLSDGFTVAINLSGTTLNDERFLEFLITELSSVDLKPGTLCFEITETAAIANLHNVVFFMKELRARGVCFALDDFGAGLSSFSYLKTLPVDYLKIDGQFVENVGGDPIDRSMVEAICKVARAMGLKTIAERVEGADILETLAKLGVNYAQGYFIAQPMPISRFPHSVYQTGSARDSAPPARAPRTGNKRPR